MEIRPVLVNLHNLTWLEKVKILNEPKEIAFWKHILEPLGLWK